jgi:D-psicose/D-tagatose/L-ribulose 3-epimerase
VIRYGAHTYLWTEYLTDADLGLFASMKTLGLDVAEVPVGDDMRLTAHVTGRAARDAGLELMISPGGLWPEQADISLGDPASARAGIDWHRKYIDLGARMGAVAYTGALYGHPGSVRREQEAQTAWPRVASALRELADFAAQGDMELLLEPMSHFRTHLVNTPEQLMALLGLVDRNNINALLDTYHMVTEVTDYARAFATAAPRLRAVHACENHRGIPGRGILPWDEIFGEIRRCRQDIVVAFESYHSASDFARRRGMFHNVCPDADAFVREAIAFCKAGLEAAERGLQGNARPGD